MEGGQPHQGHIGGASAFSVPRLPPTWLSASHQPDGPVELIEGRFEAMGTNCHVVLVNSDPELLRVAEEDVRRLQRIWTRFDPDSELNRLNGRAGHWFAVSPELALLVQRSLYGYRLTDGLFDPFLGVQLLAAGYDRDFDQLAPVPPEAPAGDNHAGARQPRHSRRPGPGSRAQLNVRRRLVRLRRDLRIDSGGIGKGLGADLVSALLMRHGAHGVLVNLGGDLRVRGRTPPGGWRIALDDPFDPDRSLDWTVTLHAGGLCTSTTLKRRWQHPSGNGIANHVIDPRTGLPLRTPLAAVTAISTSGWLAEVWSKAALIGGARRASKLLRRSPTSMCLTVGSDGTLTQVSGRPTGAALLASAGRNAACR